MIDFTMITACGECCIGCTKKESGICPGCIEADGKVPEWAESGVCKVHACCKEHHARFCGVCDEHPPFDYLTENMEVMKRVEDLAWNFDPASIGYEWNEEAGQDYQRHYPEGLGYQILRPVRKMK